MVHLLATHQVGDDEDPQRRYLLNFGAGASTSSPPNGPIDLRPLSRGTAMHQVEVGSLLILGVVSKI